MNSRRIMAYLIGLLLVVAFAATSFTPLSARAATTTLVRQATAMGVTSSGQIINLAKPPSWLKPNTLVRPLNSVSPDTLYGNYQICDVNEQCINNWNTGGEGNFVRWEQYGEGKANNEWNWWYEGTVSSGEEWPFTPGSGINDAYTGNPVYKFAFAPGGKGSGLCISQQLFGPGDTGSNLNLIDCASSTAQKEVSGKLQYFVLASNESYSLVPVQAVNDDYAYYGYDVGIWVGYDPSDANGNYVYLVTNDNYMATYFGALDRSRLP
jgi:hypothetical protein